MLRRSSRWWVGLGHFCSHGRTEDRLQGSHQVSQGIWQSPTCTVVSVMGSGTHAHRSDPRTAVRNMTSAEFRSANSYAHQTCASSCQAMPPALWHAFRGHPWLGPLTFVVPLRQAETEPCHPERIKKITGQELRVLCAPYLRSQKVLIHATASGGDPRFLRTVAELSTRRW